LNDDAGDLEKPRLGGLMSDAWYFHDGKKYFGPFTVHELIAKVATYRTRWAYLLGVLGSKAGEGPATYLSWRIYCWPRHRHAFRR
jgi:hypothetical protein